MHYPPLPPGCYLIKDPINPCCDIPKCSFSANYYTHAGELRTTTARTPGGRSVIRISYIDNPLQTVLLYDDDDVDDDDNNDDDNNDNDNDI